MDLGRAKARVEALPQVEQAQVSRSLPHTISIQITERKPIAWIVPEGSAATREELAASAKSYLVDAHGILLQPGKGLSQDLHLPIIRNYPAAHLAAGADADGEEVKSALDLLHAHQDSLIASRFQIQEIDLSPHYGLNVLGESGLQVMFGLDDMDKQLKRLDVYLQTLESRNQRIATINLLAQHNIPVTFITEPAVQADPAGTPPLDKPAASPAPAAGNPGKSSSSATKAKVKSKAHEPEKPKAKPHPHEDKEKSKPKTADASVRRALPVTAGKQPFSAPTPQ